MENRHLPEMGEVYLEVQISIVASKKLHQIRKLAYNLFPSKAYPKTWKQGQLSHHILMCAYNEAEMKITLNTLSSLNTEYERFLTDWAVSLEILNPKRAATLIARRMRAEEKKNGVIQSYIWEMGIKLCSLTSLIPQQKLTTILPKRSSCKKPYIYK